MNHCAAALAEDTIPGSGGVQAHDREIRTATEDARDPRNGLLQLDLVSSTPGSLSSVVRRRPTSTLTICSTAKHVSEATYSR